MPTPGTCRAVVGWMLAGTAAGRMGRVLPLARGPKGRARAYAKGGGLAHAPPQPPRGDVERDVEYTRRGVWLLEFREFSRYPLVLLRLDGDLRVEDEGGGYAHLRAKALALRRLRLGS